MGMKRFILLILLTVLASGTAWAGVRLDLDAGFLSGTADALHAIEVEGQTGSEGFTIFAGGGGAGTQTPSLTASLVVSHASAPTLETVTFDASGSLPGDGNFTLYEWDLDGDGTFDNSSESETVEHTYTDDGVVLVRVRITNDLGESALSDVHELEIVNRQPTARFESNLGAGTEGELIQFLNLSHDLDGPISSWAWDFGDGTTSNEASPTHIYHDAGSFRVTLSVADNDGASSAIYAQEIGILNSGPQAEFIVQGSALNASQPLFLIDESIDPSVNGAIVHVA